MKRLIKEYDCLKEEEMDNITKFPSLLLKWIPILVFLAGCSLSEPASHTGVPTSEAQELNCTPSTPTFSPTATSTPIDEVPTSVPATATESPDNTTPNGDNGVWETFEFSSQALQQNLLGDSATRTIHIYLPPGYGADGSRYPVMFALHGYIDNPSSMHGMGTQLDALIASGEAQEMIIVAPDGSNLLGGSHYMSSPTIGDYESYISRELVAYVDANYHTITDAVLVEYPAAQWGQMARSIWLSVILKFFR
jgi:hypothetical protein